MMNFDWGLNDGSYHSIGRQREPSYWSNVITELGMISFRVKNGEKDPDKYENACICSLAEKAIGGKIDVSDLHVRLHNEEIDNVTGLPIALGFIAGTAQRYLLAFEEKFDLTASDGDNGDLYHALCRPALEVMFVTGQIDDSGFLKTIGSLIEGEDSKSQAMVGIIGNELNILIGGQDKPDYTNRKVLREYVSN